MTRDLITTWPKPNLALIGFMGAGKTVVGGRLAQRLACPFLDIDEMVEKLEGASIEEIFRRRGEAYFRQVEHSIFKAAAAGQGTIIGCGGGTVLLPANRDLLRERCVSFWLRASVETLAERVLQPGHPRRPLLPAKHPEDTMRRLLDVREPLYELADEIVDTDAKDPEEVVGIILERLAAGERRG